MDLYQPQDEGLLDWGRTETADGRGATQNESGATRLLHANDGEAAGTTIGRLAICGERRRGRDGRRRRKTHKKSEARGGIGGEGEREKTFFFFFSARYLTIQ